MKIVNFDGAFFSYEDLEGNIISTPAISGSLSNQNSNTQDQLNGVIPQGNYYLYRDSIIDVKKYLKQNLIISSIKPTFLPLIVF